MPWQAGAPNREANPRVKSDAVAWAAWQVAEAAKQVAAHAASSTGLRREA